MWSIVLIGITTVLALGYWFIRKRYSYWESRGVYSPKPQFPMGNFGGLGTTRHQYEVTQQIYNDVKDKAPFSGVYLFIQPSVVIADLNLIKNILIKDFDYFRNRFFYYNEKDDPLSAHLFSIEDTKWKDLRSKLTPTFTSGKMKMMYDTVRNTANEMITTVNKIADEGGRIDVKDVVSRYSTDVIGSCAFGIDCNSLKNPQAEFRENGKIFFNPTTYEIFKQIFGSAFPALARKLGICFVRKDLSDFFIGAVKETVTFRRDNNIERKDFMHLLLEIQKKSANTTDKFTDLDIAAQAFLFFLAGFETSGSTMSFALYELARHPEIQKRLRNEINDVISKYKNEVTYDAINEMPYLDQIINETLRKYPAVETLMRKAERDYRVPETKHIIEKGTYVFIPVYGIHHDPSIYPDPDKFDPERFTDENVAKRNPIAFLPFGEGPRICIGLRFGMMQTRLGIISMIRNFHVTTCHDTPKKITFKKRPLVLTSVHDIMLKVNHI